MLKGLGVPYQPVPFNSSLEFYFYAEELYQDSEDDKPAVLVEVVYNG